MFRVLLRLYLVTIITFSAAIFLIPKLVIQLFEHRYMDYNVEQTRGLQKLIVKQYLRAPVERWSHVTEQLNRDFAPLQVKLLLRQDASYTPEEEQLLEHGKPVIRLGEWGWMEDISSPINQQFAVKLSIPPDPLDMNLLYWSMNVLIGAALLACLLFWLRPHWRDLERLKSTAAQLGRGNLSERTQIPASSNIGSLASVFDTMADDIERLLNQQRDLLNAVSHELRTPLTRLDFGLALALSEDLPQASRERLQSLVAHIRELDELVLELLSYSRLQNPAQLPERVDVVLDEFIDSVLGSVDDELENPEIVIDVALDCTVERFSLDPRLTARALQNLLRNATRYCDRRIQVGVKVCADGCEICVDDDGIGIPVEQRERIFEPFYRLDRSRDRATGGFGLGLAISRRAMEAQGGTLTALASPLGGARFRVWLPAQLD
ncbi:two-component system OmpR family sensor kinase [Pseudomonas sp. W3I7]|jgi:two-component system OmpR family sensor kinase|uniref:ATP-binding protein n=1 Tax=Pseudomonas sp. W3I7 TaxID=3042292 RepID=UPI00278DE271|nr:ATP-binding protein [Pseudomonas sp. W3I7]MDQ0704275.1 two-component system OmpR family sensor kinase [Pseudomonas sp. W3I7]